MLQYIGGRIEARMRHVQPPPPVLRGLVPRAARPQRLRELYRRLWRRWGAQGWWPAESAFEMVVGAILTQQVAWRNVEQALRNLKRRGLLTPQRLRHVPRRRLERYLRPVGFFRVKATRLRAFLTWLHQEWGDELGQLFRRPTLKARQALLQVSGIGPETADSMLLYAGHHPIFVVDAYTRRILERHGLIHRQASYDTMQQQFHTALPTTERLFSEYHALLVRLGKTYCRTVPQCEPCPLWRIPRVRGVWPTTHQHQLQHPRTPRHHPA